ncbi:MAG: response regulator receiver sensor signal transduction histidine kinase [Candidatus Magnetoglobus multicellularis str. Araruama]|uniref:histidine kinase n=1 Tax=Candidatus Magnetoglobus multicellularis str. Araruama TaxID=890399 RepID=A0A1V1P1H3_9BACT|nr:MAG: response regulator receiver sensor signal transduction histidine kinase [Candidatus Magnetoglobus multicellularis str. Araruama]
MQTSQPNNTETMTDPVIKKMHNHVHWAKDIQQKGLNILITDDDPMSRTVLSGFIAQSGAKAHEVDNGQAAVEYCQSNPVDLVLMDLDMPKMNGFDATHEIKRIKDQFIPVIVVTTYEDETILTKAQAYGADDIVSKPVSHELLLSKINAMIRLKYLYDREKSLVLHLEQKIKERDIANHRLLKMHNDLKRLVEIKTNQLRQKDIELLEMDRITSLYSLAGGMAHEINNPLGFIKSSLDNLKKLVMGQWNDTHNLQDFEKAIRMIMRMDKGVKRIVNIINILKDLSNVSRARHGPLDVNNSIRNAIEVVHSDESNYDIQMALGKIPPINSSPEEINLCLMNIITNARDAVAEKESGIISIKSFYYADNQTIVIQITDNGIGMPEKIMPRVFDPFFTTKPVGKGTGVGLTLAERIVKRHDGHIYLTSKEGQGTTVTVVLPV